MCDDEDGAWLYNFWFDTEDIMAICGALQETGGTRERAIAEEMLTLWTEQVREQNRATELP